MRLGASVGVEGPLVRVRFRVRVRVRVRVRLEVGVGVEFTEGSLGVAQVQHLGLDSAEARDQLRGRG